MAKFVPIKEIMLGHFVIPDFQRDYAWEKQNFELMLDDIMEACAPKEGRAHNKPRYVLGPLVIGATKETQGKVVDGQQRLTSLVIVLKALGEENTGFLDFENRERTKKILAELSVSRSDEEIKKLPDTSRKILEMYQLAQDYFESMPGEKGVSKEDFCNYLKTCVFFIEKRLDEGAGVQHAFEVLNTTGEPLKREDIAKAKLIADMVDLGREKEAELLNYAWGLCCDLERNLDSDKVKYGKDVLERIADIHAASSLASICEVMGFVPKDEERGTVLLAKVVDQVKQGAKIYTQSAAKKNDDNRNAEYAACLTPYRFLDTVLESKSALGRSISAISKITSDTDRAIATPDDALNVIKALLLYRTAYDRLVVRRKKGGWNWELGPIAAGEEEKRRRLILVESMMAVSGVAASCELLNAAKRAQDTALSSGGEVSAEEIIENLEKYAIKRIKEENALATLDRGVEASHFVFHWLDYLLARDPDAEIVAAIKDKAVNFSFVDTSSVEHFMPQTPLGREYSKKEEEMLDTFGNLALLTRSANSRLSNYSPKEKAEIVLSNEGRRVVSLKYELMLQIADSKGWDADTCKKHGDAMKELLRQN